MSLLETTSSLLLRTLPRKRFLQIRSSYFAMQKRAAPLVRMVYGSFSASELIGELDQRLDSDWSILLVHSSLNGLAPNFTGNALELLSSLEEYCGPNRTLVMPAFYFGEPGKGARKTLIDNPHFDLRRTPSQMGLLTELFRRSRGAIQSRHPIYRFTAKGPLAADLVEGHEMVPSGLGEGTPFAFLARHNAQIVGIGKTFQVLTQVHQVEALMENRWPAPFSKQSPISVTVKDKDNEVTVPIAGVNHHWRFNIWKLRQIMPPDLLKEWRFHGRPFFSVRAGVLTDRLVDAAKRGFVLYDE